MQDDGPLEAVVKEEELVSPSFKAPTTPRSPSAAFVTPARDLIKRRGLYTGDLVTFSVDDVPFVVQPLPAQPDTEGPVDEAFQFVLARDGVNLSEFPCHLEVLKKGNYLGFRSPAANGKFLQVQRKSTRHLLFFNYNFGVWEQWEYASKEPDVEWSKLRMYFKSRMCDYVLSVDVTRLSLDPTAFTSMTVSPHPSFGRREVAHVFDDGNAINAMSSILIREWSLFVDKEVHSRQAVEGDLATLGEDFNALRTWVAEEIAKLRQLSMADLRQLSLLLAEREGQVTQLSAHVAGHEAAVHRFWQLRSERGTLGRSLAGWWAVAKEAAVARARLAEESEALQRDVFHAWAEVVADARREEALLLADAFRALRDVCQGARAGVRQALAERALDKFARRRLSRAFDAWADWAAHRQWRMTQLQRGLGRWCNALLASAFVAWEGQSRERRRLKSVANRVMQRCRHGALATAFAGWVDRVVAVRDRRQRLAHVVAILSKHTLWASFQGLKSACVLRKENREAMTAILHRMGRVRLAAAFDGWVAFVASQAAAKKRITAMLARWRSRIQAAAFAGWVDCVRAQVEESRVVERQLAQSDMRAAHDALEAWWQHVLRRRDKKRQGRRAEIKYAASLVQRGWDALNAYKRVERMVARRAARAQARQQRRTTVAVFMSWADWALQHALLREELEHMLRQRAAALKTSAWAAWRDQARTHATWRVLTSRCLARRGRSILWQAFLAWAAMARDSARERAVVRHARRRARTALRARGFRLWREYAAEVSDDRVAAAAAAAALVRSCAGHWRQHAAAMKLQRSRAMAVADRLIRGHLRAAFDGWCDALASARSHQEGILRRAARRLAANRLGFVFAAWRAVCDHARRMQSLLSAAEARSRQVAARRAFASWGWHTQRRARQRALLGRCGRRAGERRAVSALTGWKNYVTSLKEASSHAEQRALATHRSLLYDTFQGWARVRERERVGSARVRQMSARRAVSLRLSVLRAWREETQRARSAAVRAGRQNVKMASGVLASAFSGWRTQVAAKMVFLDACRRVGRSLLSSVTATAWAAWVAHIDQVKARKGTLGLATRRTSWLRSSACFRAWRDVIQQQRQLSVAVAKSGRRVLAVRCGRCFSALRAWAMLQRGLREMWEDAGVSIMSPGKVADGATARMGENMVDATFDAAEGILSGETSLLPSSSLSSSASSPATTSLSSLRSLLARAAVLVSSVGGGLNLASELDPSTLLESSPARAFLSRRADARRLREPFTRWCRIVESAAIEREGAARADIEYTRHLCKRALKAWSERIEFLAVQRLREKTARARESRRLLTACMSGWVGMVESSALACRLLENVAAKRDVLMLGRVFHAWAGYASDTAARNHRVRRWQVRRAAALFSRLLAEWHWQAGLGARRRIFVDTVYQRHSESLLRAAMIEWGQRVEEWRSKRSLAEQVTRRADYNRAYVVFGAWQQWVERRRARRVAENARKVQAVRQRFATWWQAVALSREQDAVAAVAAADRAKRSLGALFYAWVGQTERSVRLAAVARKVAARCGVFMLAHAFRGWANFVTDTVEKRTAVAVVRDHAAQLLLRTSLLGMRAVATKAKARRDTAQGLATKQDQRVCRVVLRSWAGIVEYERSLFVASAKVALRTRRGWLSRAFATWRAAVDARGAARQQLRVCISRKRIAQRWFLRWYRDAFDSDIQRALGLILDTTEDKMERLYGEVYREDKPSGYRDVWTSTPLFSGRAEGRPLAPYSGQRGADLSPVGRLFNHGGSPLLQP